MRLDDLDGIVILAAAFDGGIVEHLAEGGDQRIPKSSALTPKFQRLNT
jgi:hypothetical protein